MISLGPYERFDIPADTRERPPCNMNWRGLLRDQLAINAMVRLYRFQQVMLTVRSSELADSEKVERKLACVLHKPDCRRR